MQLLRICLLAMIFLYSLWARYRDPLPIQATEQEHLQQEQILQKRRVLLKLSAAKRSQALFCVLDSWPQHVSLYQLKMQASKIQLQGPVTVPEELYHLAQGCSIKQKNLQLLQKKRGWDYLCDLWY